MNNIKVIITPEEGKEVQDCKKALEKLCTTNLCRLEWNDSGEVAWQTEEVFGVADFVQEEFAPYLAWKQARMHVRTNGLKENEMHKLLSECPGFDFTKIDTNDFPSLIGTSPEIDKYLGATQFNATGNIRKLLIKSEACGYHVRGRAWFPVSWNSQAQFSKNNPNLVVTLKQDVNLVQSNCSPNNYQTGFLRAYEGLANSLFVHDPKERKYKWASNGNEVNIDENFIVDKCVFLVIESTCLNGSILHADAWIEIRGMTTSVNRHTPRIADNPWNALPEHVRIDNNGNMTLNQPRGAGPNREENYDDTAVRGGAATRPLHADHDGSDHTQDRSEVLLHAYDRCIRELNRLISQTIELPENIALTA